MKSLEIIFDTNPGGCGCNCGCGGSSKVDDMNNLIDEIKEYQFNESLQVDVSPVEEYKSPELIDKINVLLSNTNAQFRVDENNIEDTLSNILPLIVLDGTILTAYGIPTLYDVVFEVEKHL